MTHVHALPPLLEDRIDAAGNGDTATQVIPMLHRLAKSRLTKPRWLQRQGTRFEPDRRIRMQVTPRARDADASAKHLAADRSRDEADAASATTALNQEIAAAESEYVVLITPDLDLLNAVTSAGYSATQLTQFEAAKHQLLQNAVPMVILDSACVPHPAAALRQLQRVLPQAVICMCGTREQRAELMNLSVSSAPFRFLVPPYSADQMRVVLAAAMARHGSVDAGTTPQAKPAAADQNAFYGATVSSAQMPAVHSNDVQFDPLPSESATTDDAGFSYGLMDAVRSSVHSAAARAVFAAKLIGAGGAGIAVIAALVFGLDALRSNAPANDAVTASGVAPNTNGARTNAVASTSTRVQPPIASQPVADDAQLGASKAPTSGAALTEQSTRGDAEIADVQLQLAKRALAAGRITEPKGDSALDYYRAVLARAPQDRQALAGMRAIAQRTVTAAEAALLDEQPAAAQRQIELLRNIDPEHQRLSFLETQLTREQQRLRLSEAQQTEARVRTLLADAALRMSQGKLTAPAGASALDALTAAQQLDAANPAVKQGFASLSMQLGQQARAEWAAGNRSNAESLLASALKLDAFNPALGDIRSTLSQPQAELDAAAALRQFKLQLASGDLIAPATGNALASLDALRALDPNHTELDGAAYALEARLLAATQSAIDSASFDDADRLLVAARDLAVPTLQRTALDTATALDAARTEQTFKSNIVPALTLKRVREVAPLYPESADRQRIEGWVDLEFTVTKDGNVRNLEVAGSEPGRIFEEAAITALLRWQFEPLQRDGAAVAQRARIRIKFAPI